MMCISLTGDQLNQVAGNNIISNINTYYSYVTTKEKKYSNFSILSNDDASASIRRHSPNWFKSDFEIGDHLWTLYTTKSTGELLIWDQVVAIDYNVDLICETWGRPWDPPKCNAPKVENI